MRTSAPLPLDRSMPVLITGGCGFIGTNLATMLAARGDRVIVFDAMARRGAEENACWLKGRWRERIEVVIGDVRNTEAVERLVKRSRAVLHLAGQVAVTTSLDDPVEDFSVNAAGTLNVLEAVRLHNPSAPLLFASTNKVYGKLIGNDDLRRTDTRYDVVNTRWQKGVAEDTPLDLYSPYGCSKGAADQYVHDYGRVFGLRTVVLRMSCIYGPRQFGTEDQGWLAHFLIKAWNDEAITLYGDGRQVRDALFVEDAAAAWLAALDRIDEVRGQIFNLGGGPTNSISLLEAITCIAELRGRRPRLLFSEWRPGDQPWYVSNIDAISAALNWTPGVALLAGLKRLNGWVLERFAETPVPVRMQGAGA